MRGSGALARETLLLILGFEPNSTAGARGRDARDSTGLEYERKALDVFPLGKRLKQLTKIKTARAGTRATNG